jgi:hypothetical protein
MRRKEIHSAPLAERVAVEQRIWDDINDEMFADPSLLELTHPTYESFFTAYPEDRYAYDYLGPSLAGRRVLELWCGTGVLSVALARSGASVTAVDVSGSSLRVTERRARHFGVSDRVTCTRARRAARLPDGPSTFSRERRAPPDHRRRDAAHLPLPVPGGRGSSSSLRAIRHSTSRASTSRIPKESDEHGTDEFFTRAMIERSSATSTRRVPRVPAARYVREAHHGAARDCARRPRAACAATAGRRPDRRRAFRPCRRSAGSRRWSIRPGRASVPAVAGRRGALASATAHDARVLDRIYAVAPGTDRLLAMEGMRNAVLSSSASTITRSSTATSRKARGRWACRATPARSATRASISSSC